MVLIVLILTYPNLPSLEVLTDYRPKIPLRVYTSDGFLIGEYGEERRAVVAFQDVPAVLKNAILAAEDDRFYQHGGIDYTGILRAAGANLIGGGKRQGASTITQQVARNFFLTGEKTYTRKLYEALLSFKIESNLSKDQIFELYINQIFLGQRAYGFAAAAQIYFGKPLKDISIAEAAMLAGLPKAPSAYNPVVNPNRARIRQQYVLRRMHELGYINDTQHAAALKEPLVVKRELAGYAVHAEYVAEMARQITAERFPEEVYSRGMKVYTTIIKAEQEAAYLSLRKGVMDYDRRHGYRGAESYLDMKDIQSDQDEAIDDALRATLSKFEHQTGLPTTLTMTGQGLPLAPDVQIQVLHIVQEALSNVRKHAGATRVELRVQRHPHWRFEVHDDGQGFDPEAVPPDSLHVGLGIMRERAQRIGAELTVASQVAGGGTCVRLELPSAVLADSPAASTTAAP